MRTCAASSILKDSMQLRIERAIYGGAGLGRSPEGEAVFVPFTLPGELVEVRRAEDQREAELLRVIEPSAARIAPDCAHFGACGGCQYQQASYDEQLRMKTAILRETMERAGISQLPEISVHAGESWHYRNRIRLRLAMVDGQIRAGYSRRSTNDFLPITMCPIAAPVLWRTAENMLQLASSDAGVLAWLQSAEEMELFCAPDETRLQLSLFLATSTPHKLGGLSFAQLCERMQAIAPIAGAGVFLRKGQRISAGERYGADGLLYDAAGATYWVSRGAFFQVNRFLVDTMVRLATEGSTGKLAWDLYAGVGLFSRRLAEHFAAVTAVEAGEPAASDLQRMLAKVGEQNHAVKATAADFLRNAVLQRERPDLIMMDPPRAGLGADVTALLARIAAPRMVYVSCDPATLGRDLRTMVDSGYRIQAMHLLDLFPQTFHLETVTILER